MIARWRGAAPSLRRRLVAAQMAVVLVGILTLLGAVEWALAAAARGGGPWLGVAPDAAAELLPLVRAITLRALALAAVVAALTGLATSLLLTGALARPLEALARGSQRIARGHYDERVPLPSSRELATVAASFNEMAASLEQIEQQRVALIGDVMHELRTPLAGLGGFLEGLLDGVIAPDEATFEQMDHEVRRLQRLVEDLQELSRIEAGQLRLALQPFDLAATAAQVVRRLAPQAGAQGVEIALDAAPGLPPVWADSDRTVQVLMNLVGNAIRYTPEGGSVHLTIRPRGAHAEVAVVDSGIGIAPEVLPLLFERFYRADRSRTRSTGGSGIGLTIARHLAWALGGDVTAESEGPGRGSTFRFTVPFA